MDTGRIGTVSDPTAIKLSPVPLLCLAVAARRTPASDKRQTTWSE